MEDLLRQLAQMKLEKEQAEEREKQTAKEKDQALLEKQQAIAELKAQPQCNSFHMFRISISIINCFM